jgi:protein TonB
MTHDYPIVLAPALAAAQAPRAIDAASGRLALRSPGSWRYPKQPNSRRRLALALVVSAGFHVAVLFGVRSHPPVVARTDDEHLLAMTIPMPNLKDLEEPEPVPRDDAAEKVELADYAPTLVDAPQIVLPNDFVQELNFASLLPQPDLTEAKVYVIPHNIIRSGNLGEGLGNIFNLADLDKVPQPIVQPAPVFPPQMKREVDRARVVVEFVVDTEGRVRNAFAVESTHDGFNDAAASGVSRWRFHPGMRGGKKVNTRMSVPIIFKLVAGEY